MTHRIEQVESTLHRALAEVFQRELSDPRIEGLVSITRVKVTPDFAEAHVYISILPEAKERKTFNGLQHALPHIQAALRKRVALRYVPRVQVKLDETLKKQAEIYSAIAEGMARTGPGESEPQESAQPPPDTHDTP